MAVFRKVNISFWEDEKVIDDFTPEDRYFMLYLMTNPHTNQIGCYNITIRQIEFETGYNQNSVEKLLERFEKIHKNIKYSKETKELFILNWHKYNWSSSPKVKACILKEAKSIKNKEFRYSMDTLFIEYGYCMDTQSQKEKEKEQEKDKEEEQQFNIYGEHCNVYLTKKNYEKLLADCLSQKLLDEIINTFSNKIETGDEKQYNLKLPTAHFVRLRKYLEYRRKNPEKFIIETKKTLSEDAMTMAELQKYYEENDDWRK